MNTPPREKTLKELIDATGEDVIFHLRKYGYLLLRKAEGYEQALVELQKPERYSVEHEVTYINLLHASKNHSQLIARFETPCEEMCTYFRYNTVFRGNFNFHDRLVQYGSKKCVDVPRQ